ncbi:hypothetical protein LINPERHAP1_LOCUS98 [Linum perenne]
MLRWIGSSVREEPYNWQRGCWAGRPESTMSPH